MPIALALVASALIHAAALMGPGWDLPGVHEADATPTIDAVLTKTAPRAEPAPVAKPVPKPHVDKPRRQAVAAAESVVAAASETSSVPSVPSAPPAVPPPEMPPVAVTGPRSGIPGTQSAPAPSAGDTAPGSAGGITFEPAVEPAPVPIRIALPAKGRLRYAITRGEGGFVIGQSVHTWQHDGLTYQLQSVTETTGLAAFFKPAHVVQSSHGEVTAGGLKPHEFRHERVGGVDTASFDWTRQVVAYAGREDKLAAGTQDMLSMYYQVVLLAPQSGVLEIPIATGRKLESFRIEIIGEEVVLLAAAERRAMRLRVRSGNDTIELWLGVGKDADMRALPLKIRFTDRKGEIFDQLAEDIDIQDNQ